MPPPHPRREETRAWCKRDTNTKAAHIRGDDPILRRRRFAAEGRHGVFHNAKLLLPSESASAAAASAQRWLTLSAMASSAPLDPSKGYGAPYQQPPVGYQPGYAAPAGHQTGYAAPQV